MSGFGVRNYAALSLILMTLMFYVPIIFCKNLLFPHFSGFYFIFSFILFCFLFIKADFTTRKCFRGLMVGSRTKLQVPRAAFEMSSALSQCKFLSVWKRSSRPMAQTQLRNAPGDKDCGGKKT